MEDFCRISETF